LDFAINKLDKNFTLDELERIREHSNFIKTIEPNEAYNAVKTLGNGIKDLMNKENLKINNENGLEKSDNN